MTIDLNVPGVEAMHQRAGAKWSAYDADVLSATIAEMDFPLAPPVAEALHDAIIGPISATRSRRRPRSGARPRALPPGA